MEATLQSPFGQTILEPGVVTIGSTPDSRLVLHGARVSPHHALVRSTEQGYTITDWGSSEGTFVNDQRLDPLVPRLLTVGDRIRIGETVFTYEVYEGPALVQAQGSRSMGEPAVLPTPSAHTAYGTDAEAYSVLTAPTQYGSEMQQLIQAPSEQSDVPMDMKVEPEPLSGEVASPGKPVTHHCPQCHAELPAGAHFCGKCGFPGIGEAGLDDEVSANQASALAHAPSQQPDILPASLEANLVSEAPPLQLSSAPPVQPRKPPAKGRQWKMPRRWRLWALIALIILLVGGSVPFLISWLGTVLPAATASITITPASQHLTRSYTISAVTGTPDASQHQVQARVLSFTTKALSKTVKATGQGHQDATWATGKVTISPQSGTLTAQLIRVPSNSGVNVIVNVTNSISSGSQTFDASAENAGSGGNIPAYDIDGSYHLVADPSVNIYVQNTQAFTGGQDAADYTFVQQSDIDGAATPLADQLTPAAQSAVQQQVQANEQFVSAPECTSTIKANHKADDRVSDVTVTVTVTCKGEVYDAQAARAMAADWLKSDATSQPGTPYALVGDVVTAQPQVLADDAGTVTLSVSAEGMWVYQISEAQKQQLAQLITGKPLTDAQALLLKQTGVKKASITTAGGWGSALPTSPNDIKFTVVPVSGLQATP